MEFSPCDPRSLTRPTDPDLSAIGTPLSAPDFSSITIGRSPLGTSFETLLNPLSCLLVLPSRVSISKFYEIMKLYPTPLLTISIPYIKFGNTHINQEVEKYNVLTLIALFVIAH